MPSLGTAPHRVSPGIWITFGGRKLTPAGSAYWERAFRSGRTDGRGHMTRPSIMLSPPPVPHPPTPTVKPGRAGIQNPHVSLADQLTGHATPAQKRQQKLYNQTRHQPHYNPKTAQSTAADALLQAQNPHLLIDTLVTALSPATMIGEGYHALKHGDVLGAGLAAASILPFGRGAKAAKAIKEAEEAARTARGLLPRGIKGVEGGIRRTGGAPKPLGPHGPLTIEEHVAQAFGGPEAKRAIAAKQKLLHEERKRRAGLIEDAYWNAGGGEEGMAAVRAALRGPMGDVEFNALAGMDSETLRRATDAAFANPGLLPYEKSNIGIALKRAQEGKDPRSFEVALINKAFGREKAIEFAHPDPVDKSIWNYLGDVLSIPRTIRSVGDLSEFFRQAIMLMANDPKLVLGKIPVAFQMAFSKAFYEQSMAKIVANPRYELKIGSGLELPRHDERFLSDLASKIPVVGILVRGSDRGFTGPLNLMRSEKWDKMFFARGLDQLPDGPERQKAMESISRFVNWSTGRGDIGRLGGETPRKIINGVLWSPGLFKSRLDIFNLGFYKKLEPAERVLVAKTLVQLVAYGVTVMGMAAFAATKYGAKVKVGYDPRSADFGKIKWGNTRYDVFGGNQQITRAAAQIITETKINTSTGEHQHLGGGFGQTSQFDVGLNFLLGKESPAAGLATAKLRGRGFDNKPFSLKKELLSWTHPLLWQDISDVIHNDPNLAEVLAAASLGFFGVGVQSYSAPSASVGTGGYKDRLGGGYKDPFADTTTGGYSDPFANLP